jgi:glycosyltransferase involved in cell wall biosynthesis
LTARGHRAKALVWPANCLDGQGGPELELAYWPSRRPTRLADAWFYWRELRSTRPEAVIANFGSVNWMISLGWLAGVPLRAAHCHTLSTQLAYDTTEGKLRTSWLPARKRLVYRLATHLIANSTAAADDAAEAYGIPPAKRVVQYFGLEDPFPALAPPPAAARPLRLVCPGRLDYSKGQDVLIRALPGLLGVFPGLEVRFLGDGPQRQNLEELAAKLGVGGACRFTGSVPHGQVLRELSECVAAVIPSRHEAFGMVNVEAISLGTPVVASRVGGIPEIVRDGLDGFLVAAGDPAAIQSCLGRLLADAGLRADMGRNARERFLSAFELRQRVSQYADWLELEVQRCRGRRRPS